MIELMNIDIPCLIIELAQYWMGN